MVTNIEPTISVSVKSKEQLEAVLSLEPDRVYVTDEKLYQEYREREKYVLPISKSASKLSRKRTSSDR